MKWITYQGEQGEPHVGAVVSDRVYDISGLIKGLPLSQQAAGTLHERGGGVQTPSMLMLLLAGKAGFDAVQAALEDPVSAALVSRPLSAVKLMAPLPRPGKIVAIGRNYGDHARESGTAAFEKPRIISKLPSSVCAPGTRVLIPPAVLKPDFEVELGVVIGAYARNVDRERSMSCVAGYTVLNDISAREFQFDVSPPQTTFAKSFDQSCPMGPWIVTADEISDVQNLDLSCVINGERLQQGNTAEMIFPVDELISYLSQYMTLEPGDVIATGTPAGVGAFRTPPRWLTSGDHVVLHVDQVGVLEHWIG